MINQKRDSKKHDITSDIMTKAAEGDAIAQLKLGKIYYKATSTKGNYTLAFDWIRLSAEQGNMEAQFRLGDLYALGFGAGKKITDSYQWYTKSAIQGYKKALIRIHNLYQQDTRMHCRGQLTSEEYECVDHWFMEDNGIRELHEYRLHQNHDILNGIIDYYTNQFKYYQLCDQTDPFVQLDLAFLYQHGYGTKKCSRWAFEYYLLAAEQGNRDAQYNLGYLYQQHTEKKFHVRDAFKWYTMSAQSGHMVAQKCLAYFYLKGLATDIDYKMAVFWYTKAASTGDSQAQVTLGMLYRKGDYVEQDLSTAVKWYTLAARQGNTAAQNCLSQLHQHGVLTDIKLEEDVLEYLTEDSMNSRLCSKLSVDVSKLGDPSEFKQLNKLAKHALMGDGPAMYEIGLNYFHGNNEFPQDKDTGIKWIKHAANKKHKDAQFMMAKLYKEGESIKQDCYKSYIWYKTITKQKIAEAQYQVGIMYYKGLGVRKDPLEASKWFIWAADQENSDSQLLLGILRLCGHGIRRDKKEAQKWFYRSVYQRNKDACFELGKMIFDGIDGFKKHPETGLKLLEFAAKNGHIDAQLFLGYVYLGGDNVKQDASKGINYHIAAADSGNSESQYIIALEYLQGNLFDRDYIKAYRLFKLAEEGNYVDAKELFRTPLIENRIIKNYSKIIKMFTKVTKNGIADLSFNIGSIYEYGIKRRGFVNGVDANCNKAKKWYLVASNKGDSRADYRLGIMYEEGKGVEQNMATAINHYNKAVEMKNGKAMYKLARMYLNGSGVSQNFLEAFILFSKASIIGYPEAAEELRSLQENTEIDHDFVTMFEKATEERFTQLQYQLGVNYERNSDYSKAFKWLSLAADIGVTDAYYMLGVMYEEGKGVDRNYKMAADMYQKATEKDHKDACFRIAQLFQNGSSVKRDYLKAYNFYKKAADMNHVAASKILNITQEINIKANRDIGDNFFQVQSRYYRRSLVMCKYVAEHGNTEVQFKIGFAYEHCYSKPNYREAFKWYAMAAKHSHKDAMYHLGLLYENGLGVSRNYHKAIQLYNQAAHIDSDDALHRLGIVYHYGKGVDIDPIKAVEYYTLSTRNGNPRYQCELGRLYQEGELVPKNLLETLKWYTKAYLQGYDSIGSELYALYKDKPYENFFFKRLFRNLSTASQNYFSLDDSYSYEDLGDINNKLGFMYLFGLGTSKDLEQSLQHFLKRYLVEEITSITDFRFFDCINFSFDQKVKILDEFANDEAFIHRFSLKEQYTLGMVFYEGRVGPQYFNYDDKKKLYTSIDEDSLDDPSERIAIEKNYVKALTYIKSAADKKYPPAWIQLGIMYYYGHGVQKNRDQSEAYFGVAPHDDTDLILEKAILYHTHNDIQNFSKALEYYNHLEQILVDGFDAPKKDREEINELVQTGLGLLYEYGDGVEKDYQRAINHYQNLADDNNKMGYLRLGLMHYYGKGVPVNYEKAKDLFDQSLNGKIYLDKLPYVYLQTSKDADFWRKLVYCTKDRWETHGESFYYEGLMHKYGQAVPVDEDKAEEHFRLALEYDCQRATNEFED